MQLWQTTSQVKEVQIVLEAVKLHSKNAVSWRLSKCTRKDFDLEIAATPTDAVLNTQQPGSPKFQGQSPHACMLTTSRQYFHSAERQQKGRLQKTAAAATVHSVTPRYSADNSQMALWLMRELMNWCFNMCPYELQSR